jgi:dynein heavy chain
VTIINKLEQDLLDELSRAKAETILDTDDLVLKLEETKRSAAKIMEAQKVAKDTEKIIEEARKVYVPIAEEGSMLYFLLITLSAVHVM